MVKSKHFMLYGVKYCVMVSDLIIYLDDMLVKRTDSHE